VSNICPHDFEQEDPRNPGYSLTEFDLAARLGLTIRKNFKAGTYEIVAIATGIVHYSYGTLEEVVHAANELERANYIEVNCGPLCPARRRG